MFEILSGKFRVSLGSSRNMPSNYNSHTQALWKIRCSET